MVVVRLVKKKRRPGGCIRLLPFFLPSNTLCPDSGPNLGMSDLGGILYVYIRCFLVGFKGGSSVLDEDRERIVWNLIVEKRREKENFVIKKRRVKFDYSFVSFKVFWFFDF